MRTIKIEHRKKTNIMLKDFFEKNQTFDIVAYCDVLGGAIFWNVPYSFREDVDSIELYIQWGSSEKVEYSDNHFSPDCFPNPILSTKYNNISKCSKKEIGPIAFNTGGGYRYMIYFHVFGHSDNENYASEVKALLNDFMNK